jgi:hypothetical protein
VPQYTPVFDTIDSVRIIKTTKLIKTKKEDNSNSKTDFYKNLRNDILYFFFAMVLYKNIDMCLRIKNIKKVNLNLSQIYTELNNYLSDENQT